MLRQGCRSSDSLLYRRDEAKKEEKPRRMETWMANISRTDFSHDKENKRVCSTHFINGKYLILQNMPYMTEYVHVDHLW